MIQITADFDSCRAKDGLTSHYAPYRLEILYARNAKNEAPDPGESPLQAYHRLRS